MSVKKINQLGYSIHLFIVILVAIVIACIGFSVYNHNSNTKSSTANTPGSTGTAKSQTSTQTSAFVGYSSPKEGATFEYPNNWTFSKTPVVSNDSSNNDQIAVTSPSGNLTVSWVTDLTGFGNEKTASYPLNTIVDKTPISKSPGLFVVSGITTLDGTNYHPWIAVQDSNGVLTDGVQGNLITFTAHKATNPSTHNSTKILFSTSGPRTTDNTPSMTKQNAMTYLSGPEAQQAKQILLSLIDP